MGNTDTKLNFRKTIIQLGTKNQQIEASDEQFWEQFWTDHSTTVQDVFALIPASEIRTLRENNPANLATLCYKATERLVRCVDSSCRTQTEQQAALNCMRLLSRILPYILEDAEWKSFFWSSLPSGTDNDDSATPLAHSLLNAICDLLFCPDFTVVATRRSGPDKAEELANIDSCEYIWEAGVGFAQSPPKNAILEQRRTELLKLLLCCFSETMYRSPNQSEEANKWIVHFTSSENRHALPLFTSLLNTVSAYDPVGLGMPYNHIIFSDTMEPLVEVCLQILIVTLDHDMTVHSPTSATFEEASVGDNLFINYLSRVHRDEDFQFILKGITRLLNNPLVQSYLPNSTKRLHCHQELLVFFWKICDYNKKFLYYVLKSSDVLDILVPILYHLNDSRADQSRVGLMHIGVFILLLLSGERNFGVRLNKPYTATVPMDITVFTGSVFHKIIATCHQRLQPLFDCLLTILVNVSPYLKTLSMVAAIKLLHLLEAFSTPWFLFSAPSNHHLVFFLLEIFNNIIQYQFDGNSNLVYTIIRKRHVFHALANLPSDYHGISKCLNNRKGIRTQSRIVAPPPEERSERTPSPEGEAESSDGETKGEIIENSMEGSKPALPAEPGTLKVSLLDTPDLGLMTESESAHPNSQPEFAEFAPVDESELINDLDEASLKSAESPSKNSLKEPSPFKRAVAQARLQPLFDCLLTILVNVSPYLKTLSMVAAIKLLHLLEAFSTPWFLFSAPSNHHLVFFLLEIFNNIIQYQFDGNSNLVYTIIRKRHVFHALANLPSDYHGISKCLNNRKGIRTQSRIVAPPPEERSERTPSPEGEAESSDGETKGEIIENSMEGSKPALPAEPGTLKVSLLDTPDLGLMTESESAHPNSQPEFAEFAPVDESELINDLDEASLKSAESPSKNSLKEPSPFKRAVAQIHGRVPHACTVCSKEFLQKRTLVAHMRLMHTGDHAYPCTACGEGFRTKAELNQHNRQTHGGVNPNSANTTIVVASAQQQQQQQHQTQIV